MRIVKTSDSPAGKAGRRPKQVSVPNGFGGGKVSEKWIRAKQFWALGFSRKRRKGHAIKNLPEALQTEAVTFKLSTGREVKTNISYELLAPFREGQNRKEAAANSDVSHFQIEASNRHGGNKYASCCRTC
jgi:hypothetical protein